MEVILVALDENLTKGALQEYRGPLFFSIFKQISIMISLSEWLIALCEWFNMCMQQSKHNFRWLSVSKQIGLIIAHNVESVEQNP